MNIEVVQFEDGMYGLRRKETIANNHGYPLPVYYLFLNFQTYKDHNCYNWEQLTSSNANQLRTETKGLAISTKNRIIDSEEKKDDMGTPIA